MSNLFEPGRFAGCPPICLAENLPAFETEAEARQWHAAPGRGNPLYEANLIKHIGKCRTCQKWHYKTKLR